MQIKRLGKSDSATVNHIVANLIDPDSRSNALPDEAHITMLLNNDSAYLFAAMLNSVVVGYTLAYRFPSLYATAFMAYLYDIEVTPAHQRCGIGRQLIATLLAHLKADGVKEVWLGTGVDNKAGQALFSATGAEKSAEAFNDYTYYL